MQILNLGILAHVDAGKTSLTERLLYQAGVIDKIGSVDQGNTTTDSLSLERQRGITIKSAVAAFSLGDIRVNLIDTPGHPDFIAEVEHALRVLDGVVLVLSAVEGVQPQTRILMRALQRLQIPTLLFVNKIDRRGADPMAVAEQIRRRLTPDLVVYGSVRQAGSTAASYHPPEPENEIYQAELMELLAQHDEEFFARYVADTAAAEPARLHQRLAKLSRAGVLYPVLFGSAMTGAGISELTSGIEEFLPSVSTQHDGETSAEVFKIERGGKGEKLAYLRVFSGAIALRETLQFKNRPASKVTSIELFRDGRAIRSEQLSSGEIGRLQGLTTVQIGDVLGELPRAKAGLQFAAPDLETKIRPETPALRGRLFAALAQLAEQDPLINVRQDAGSGDIFLSLYGEVQKEIIAATLANDFNLQVSFEETITICVERLSGSAQAAELMGEEGNPFRATVGLRISPAELDSGLSFELGVELGSMPLAFFKAVEETVRETLEQGLFGWRVTDCTVTMTHSGFTPPPPHGWSKWSSSASDFKALTPLVLMTALREAGTTVCEPLHRFDLEVPSESLKLVLPVLAELQARTHGSEVHAEVTTLSGEIPAASVHRLKEQLPAISHGEGVLDSRFSKYQAVTSAIPSRPRTDRNPLNRSEYLKRVQRRD